MNRSRSLHTPDLSDLRTVIPLADLAAEEIAVVAAIRNAPTMRQRLLDLGLAEGTEIVCLGRSPAGDPSAYRIRGAVIALRRQDSMDILVEHITGKELAWD